LDGPFPKLCPAVALSHQDGRHSAVALLKAALIEFFFILILFKQLLSDKIFLEQEFF
jgi:hypothetical protein